MISSKELDTTQSRRRGHEGAGKGTQQAGKLASKQASKLASKQAGKLVNKPASRRGAGDTHDHQLFRGKLELLVGFGTFPLRWRLKGSGWHSRAIRSSNGAIR